MKYHINFGSDKRLSFEILDTAPAQSWADIVKKDLKHASRQRVYRYTFPKLEHPLYHFNSIVHNYNKVKEFGLDTGFDLNTDLGSYSTEDIHKLFDNIEKLYLIVVKHQLYYADKKNSRYRFHCKRLMRAVNELQDSMFNTSENYSRIKIETDKPNEMLIPVQMRQYDWVEKARPNLVIRLQPNFDLKSLNIMEQRDNSIKFDNSYSHMHYITSDHKICYYENSLTQSEAEQFMAERRNKMLDFVVNNNIDVVPGSLEHYNFVLPVVAHCINADNYTDKELCEMFKSQDDVTIEIEE
jgi:phage pi2 protein 07